MASRYQLRIAYDGTNYCGWQKLPPFSSIQEAIESVLEKILLHKVDLEAASRTDSGVHAKGQIAAFTTDKEIKEDKLLISLNQLLPKDISILEVVRKKLSFHPTLDNKGKEYRYFITLGTSNTPWKRHFSWHVPSKLNIDAMKEASSHFLGTHHFASFTNRKKNETYSSYVRTIHSLEIKNQENELEMHIRGNKFLYKMVRNIVGTLVSVGKGKLSPSKIPLILKEGSRLDIGPTAPAAGLFLWEVLF